MTRSMKCLRCSSSFLVPTTASDKPVVCPRCGTTRDAEESAAITPAQNASVVKPPLTDDDILSFLGPPVVASTPPKTARMSGKRERL